MPSVVPGAPRTMASSLTTSSLPRSGRAETVGTDREDDDEGRDREPRPLATVETPQDEVVDRPDEQDVDEQDQDQAADRREGQRRQLRDRSDQQVVVEEGQTAGRPCRQHASPQVLRAVCLGDPVDARVEAEESHRAGAVRPLGRDDPIADRRERAAVDELAATAPAASSRRSGARRADRSGRPRGRRS